MRSPPARLFAGLYPLLLALMAGGILIDQQLARSHGTAGDAATRGIADALLLLSLPVVAAGIAAIALGNGRARMLSGLSLGLFALEFLLPPLVRMLPGGAWLTFIGPQLRAGAVLAALLLAWLALKAQRQVRP